MSRYSTFDFFAYLLRSYISYYYLCIELVPEVEQLVSFCLLHLTTTTKTTGSLMQIVGNSISVWNS